MEFCITYACAIIIIMLPKTTIIIRDEMPRISLEGSKMPLLAVIYIYMCLFVCVCQCVYVSVCRRLLLAGPEIPIGGEMPRLAQ